MQLLDWLVVVTVGAIILVLLDGFRRKWSDRRNRVVMKLDRNIPQDAADPDELPNSELPNGGARTLVRNTDPPQVSPLRRRNFNLKDGRDKVRSAESGEIASVPVLMDAVEIEEDAIEHANVFVSADSTVAASDFDEDELPPEISSGLDEDYQKQPTSPAALVDQDQTRDLDDTLDSEPDPLMDGSRFRAAHEAHPSPALEEEEGLDAERIDAADSESDTPSDSEEDDDSDYLSVEEGELEEGDTEELPAGTAEEEYDPSQDENYYENEPALLENAYQLAKRGFQRPVVPEQPRIEPGFDEAHSEEAQVESHETFGALIDETVMDEFLAEEAAEIRAYRNQSVTRNEAPIVPPTPPVLPAAQTTTSAPGGADSRAIPPVQQVPATPNVSTPAVAVPAPKFTMPPIQPVAVPEPEMADDPLLAVPENSMEIAGSEAPPQLPPAAAKPTKPGFWQTMTGKSASKVAKAGKTETPAIDQGELFAAEPEPVMAQEEPLEPAQEVLIINVMAKQGAYFRGDELLPVLQHFGLRLGQMNIFHRHEDMAGHGPVMFSMANIVKPGTFSLADMQDLLTPGVSFFMQLPNRHGNMKAFEQMLSTANAIKQTLDGVLKDERRSVLTRQTVEHCRQRIRDFELAELSRK